jgi:hypothetical protein
MITRMIKGSSVGIAESYRLGSQGSISGITTPWTSAENWKCGFAILFLNTRLILLASFRIWLIYLRGCSSNYPLSMRQCWPRADLDTTGKGGISCSRQESNMGLPSQSKAVPFELPQLLNLQSIDSCWREADSIVRFTVTGMLSLY